MNNCTKCTKTTSLCDCSGAVWTAWGYLSSTGYEHVEHTPELPKPEHQCPIAGWGRPACECGQRDEFGIKHSDYCRLSKHPNPEEKIQKVVDWDDET